MIRTAKTCKVPTLNAKGVCGDRAIGQCMVDCRWEVCAFHFAAAEAAGFCPETWEQKQQRTIARTWANNQHKTRQRHVAHSAAPSCPPFSGCGAVPPAGAETGEPHEAA